MTAELMGIAGLVISGISAYATCLSAKYTRISSNNVERLANTLSAKEFRELQLSQAAEEQYYFALRSFDTDWNYNTKKWEVGNNTGFAAPRIEVRQFPDPDNRKGGSGDPIPIYEKSQLSIVQGKDKRFLKINGNLHELSSIQSINTVMVVIPFGSNSFVEKEAANSPTISLKELYQLYKTDQRWVFLSEVLELLK